MRARVGRGPPDRRLSGSEVSAPPPSLDGLYRKSTVKRFDTNSMSNEPSANTT